MKINASAGRSPKSVDLRDHCEHLKLDAQNDDEAEFLAELYKALASGRAITIEGGITFTTAE